LLLSKIAEYGTKWTIIAQWFPNRSESALVGHYVYLRSRIP
jgi:hypothetical protein